MIDALYPAVRVVADVTTGTGIDPLTALSQLGIGALIAAPFAYMWRSVHGDLEAKDKEIRELRDERVAREQHLSDVALPRLMDAITTLSATQQGMGAALRTQAAPTGQEQVLGELARQLQSAVNALTNYGRRDT